VPVRANITQMSSTDDLLKQLQTAHNNTLEHQHVALRDIHRITGHGQLFDTVFVFENYPIGTAASEGIDELVIAGVTNRDYYHYPLAVQAVPGRELELRLQFRTDVFDESAVEALVERYERVLVTMTASPTEPLSLDVFDGVDQVRPDTSAVSSARHRDADGGFRPPASLVEQILAGIFASVLERDRVGVNESFFDLGGDSISAMRVVAAVNAALGIRLAVSALFEAPSVTSLSQRVADASDG
jgi:non-ribosomal peptide synthetase component F